MNKLEARKIQMLARQRAQLEEEMVALQAEVETMVSPYPSYRSTSRFPNEPL